PIVDLDEVGALLLEETHHGARFFGSAHRDSELRIGPGIGAIHDRAAGDNFGTELLARGNRIAQGEDLFGGPTHVADPQDTIGYVHLEITGSIAEVHMHIPEAGDHVHAGAVDDFGGGGQLDGV